MEASQGLPRINFYVFAGDPGRKFDTALLDFLHSIIFSFFLFGGKYFVVDLARTVIVLIKLKVLS